MRTRVPRSDETDTGSSVVQQTGVLRIALPTLCPASPFQLVRDALDFGFRGLETPDARLARKRRRFSTPHGLFDHVGEERGEAVEVLREVGIELVVVALGAARVRAEPHGRGVAHPVGEVDGAILLRLRPLPRWFAEGGCIGGDLLLERRILEQIARKLLEGERSKGRFG
jgi:hypothetical protein